MTELDLVADVQEILSKCATDLYEYPADARNTALTVAECLRDTAKALERFLAEKSENVKPI